MYAIIKTGGKQYRVALDDVIDVELLTAEPGKEVEFNEVLFVHDGSNAHIGEPNVSGYTVKAEVLDKVRGPKITSMKYRPRGGSSRKIWGHRQHYLRVKITGIGSVKSTAKPAKAKKESAPKEEKPKAAAKPKTETKPKAAAKPKTTKAAAKPKTETKPKAAAKPKAKKTTTKKSKGE